MGEIRYLSITVGVDDVQDGLELRLRLALLNHGEVVTESNIKMKII